MHRLLLFYSHERLPLQKQTMPVYDQTGTNNLLAATKRCIRSFIQHGRSLATNGFNIRFAKSAEKHNAVKIRIPVFLYFFVKSNKTPKAIQNHPASPKNVTLTISLSKTGVCMHCNASSNVNSQLIFLISFLLKMPLILCSDFYALFFYHILFRLVFQFQKLYGLKYNIFQKKLAFLLFYVYYK